MDERIIRAIISMHGGSQALDSFAAFTAEFSSVFFAAVFLFAVLFAAIFRKNERLELCLAAIFLLAATMILNYSIRAVAARQRPFEVVEGLVPLAPHSPGNSFPSNHAAAAFAVAFFVRMVKPGAGLAFLILAGLVSFSRVYAGLHFPSDVIAGMALAAMVWIAAARVKAPAAVFFRRTAIKPLRLRLRRTPRKAEEDARDGGNLTNRR